MPWNIFTKVPSIISLSAKIFRPGLCAPQRRVYKHGLQETRNDADSLVEQLNNLSSQVANILNQYGVSEQKIENFFSYLEQYHSSKQLEHAEKNPLQKKQLEKVLQEGKQEIKKFFDKHHISSDDQGIIHTLLQAIEEVKSPLTNA
jgi:hypothetical protein